MNFEKFDSLLFLGCGGGFDIWICLPWLLKYSKKTIYLMNHSFTDDLDEYVMDSPFIHEIHDQVPCTNKNQDYFPEKWLAATANQPVYAMRSVSPAQLAWGLSEWLIKHPVQAIVLFDGGSDAMLWGDEHHMGSPVEDMNTLMVVQRMWDLLKIPSFLACSSTTTEQIPHENFLRNVQRLRQHQGYLGVTTCVEEKVWLVYKELLDKVPKHNRSIINETIWASTRGEFGCNDQVENKMWDIYRAVTEKIPNQPDLYRILNEIIVQEFKSSKFINERLNERITDNNYPPCSPLTDMYWWFNVQIYAQVSPLLKTLYQNYDWTFNKSMVQKDLVAAELKYIRFLDQILEQVKIKFNKI